MVSDKTYREIAHEVIGDTDSNLFEYKSGPVLVEIFNHYFNYADVYQGNLSRWFYVVEKIKDIGLENFLQVFLSSKYLRSNEGFFRNNVESAIVDRINKFNFILDKEDYKLARETEGKCKLVAIVDEEEIGSGGYAKVYFVPDMNMARKQLRFEYRTDKNIQERFKKEYEITKSLSDVSGIMEVYSFDEGNCSYLMQFCDTTLYKYIEMGIASEEEKINVIHRILEIMSAVHNRDIIHRDLSPTNIFMNNGEIVVGDFGLGRNCGTESTRLTMFTNQVGQYLYVAPEQYESLKNSTTQSDVYSLGKVINYIMAGTPNLSNHKFYGLSSKAISENPHNRHTNAEEMLEELKRVIDMTYQKNLIEKVQVSLATADYNNEINDYILTLSEQELSDFLAENENADDAILNLINDRPKIANNMVEKLIHGVKQGYPWEQNDRFSQVAYQIILSKNNISYEAKLSSAKLLNYVAYSINRFNAQKLIDELIREGVEPSIEDELVDHGF